MSRILKLHKVCTSYAVRDTKVNILIRRGDYGKFDEYFFSIEQDEDWICQLHLSRKIEYSKRMILYSIESGSCGDLVHHRKERKKNG